MRAVYIDTGAFIALIWTRDHWHDRIRAHFLKLRRDGDLLLTSDPVVGETATRLRYDAGLSAALQFRRILDEAVAGRLLRVRETDPKLRRSAFEIMATYESLRLSYADCVGAAVAREGRAEAVFALDEDFRIMGFEVEPGRVDAGSGASPLSQALVDGLSPR